MIIISNHVGALISGVHNVTPLFNEHLPMRPFDEDQWEDAFVVIQNIEIYFFYERTLNSDTRQYDSGIPSFRLYL